MLMTSRFIKQLSIKRRFKQEVFGNSFVKDDIRQGQKTRRREKTAYYRHCRVPKVT